MSLDAAGGRRSVSPPSSGRASPVPRATRRTVESDLFKADKGLRRYGATVERALSTWEISPDEWADYIAFLARLLKAIQAGSKDAPILPHSSSIATRLAQCLNPALPSGVHQKALEVYTYIFSTFGNDYIAAHLHEFLPGLTPVLSFASLSVRPLLYDLFQAHIVHLTPSELRPALKSIILGLLPALEEGQGEDFEHAFAILSTLESSFAPQYEDAVSATETDGYFWQCLFLAIITSPSRRQGALKYLLRQLPTFNAVSIAGQEQQVGQLSREAACIVSPEPGLLIRCFVCGLSDSQILVQRDFLDLLVAHLPLNSPVLQEKAGSEDRDRLVSAAAQVILRRDMSLNRRLWGWFLGPEPKEQSESSRASSPELSRHTSGESGHSQQLRYFSAYGKASLERCVLSMLQASNQSVAQKARPYRICLSLMDRWEIGGLLMPSVFLPAMQTLYEYSLSASSSDFTEVMRSAHQFFDGIEASLIWESLIGILRDALERQRAPAENLLLFAWVINTFNVRDEEMITLHIPYAMLFLTSYLNSIVSSGGILVEVISIISKLNDFVPLRALQNSNAGASDASSREKISDADHGRIQKNILDFYKSEDQSARRKLPYDARDAMHLLWAEICKLLRTSLLSLDPELYQTVTSLLLSVMNKAPDLDLRGSGLRGILTSTFMSESSNPPLIPFPIVNATVNLISAMASMEPETGLLNDDIAHLAPSIITQLWYYMSPNQPKYHLESVKSLWQVEDLISPGDTLTATLTGLVKTSGAGNQAEAIRRFAVLWSHSVSAATAKTGSIRRGSAMSVLADPNQISRVQDTLEQPLLLVLDGLRDPTAVAFEVAKGWLGSLSTLEQVLQLLFHRLFEVDATSIEASDPSQRNRLRHHDQHIRDFEYFLDHICNILTHGNQWTWRCLSRMALNGAGKDLEHNGVTGLADLCIRLLVSERHTSESLNRRLIEVLDLLLTGPADAELQSLDLDTKLLDRLIICISTDMHSLQGKILQLVQLALKLRLRKAPEEPAFDARSPVPSQSKRPSTATTIRPSSSASATSLVISPPAQLFRCLRLGFSSSKTRYHLDQWLSFLADILPTFADAIFSNLIPLVETFCGELSTCHRQLVSIVAKNTAGEFVAPEAAIMSLLDGLEMVLDRAYECLLNETANDPAPKEPESRSSFLSNVTSGVFKSEGPPSRTASANSRLTVILAFQDAIRVGMKMWLWASHASEASDFDAGSAATAAHNALKVRNKARHVLEQMFSLEPLESLEVVIAHWCSADTDAEASSALSLLHVMQVSRPKNVVPAILDALCSRTNPASIPSARHSSLTLDLSASNVAAFLSAYLDSTEDDAMDEVWPDCVAFLRDVLGNPLPYRQILPHMLSIILLLAEKLNNTNFGEQRKMRRDLGDILQRLLTATFTALPSGYISEPLDELQNGASISRSATIEQSMTLLPVLNRVTAKLDIILESPERMTPTINSTSQSLVSPIFRSRSFPKNVTPDLLEIIVNLSRKAPTSKAWKKEITDAFNDPKILGSSPEMMTNSWFPVFHQWSLHDKERMSEVISRLSPPSSAGIMFGVGASAARLEADRKTQLNVRRICLLLLASPEDTYVSQLRSLEEKFAELFEASPASSPSAAIKADLFMLCRTLALSMTALQLAPLWPIINDKLQTALNSLLPNSANSEDFNNLTLLQSCKLLDLLIALSPDEFQLHEWLYITDTIDAVYQPPDWTSAALTDHVAEALGSIHVEDSLVPTTPTSTSAGRRRPLLDEVDHEDVKAMARENFARAVLRPFLSQLSIHAYEGVYSLDVPDVRALRGELLVDLLDLGTVVE